MIADIFYPIFTVMITVLVCFIQKKNIWGLCTHAFTRALHWTPGGLQLPPKPPAIIVFSFAKN